MPGEQSICDVDIKTPVAHALRGVVMTQTLYGVVARTPVTQALRGVVIKTPVTQASHCV